MDKIKRDKVLAQTVERMKAEIVLDALKGVVPFTVHSFSELHDYVDANEYGGFCEDDAQDRVMKAIDEPSIKWHVAQQLFYEFTSEAQNLVADWIRDYGLHRTLTERELDKKACVQEFNEKGSNWVDRLGTSNIQLAANHADFLRREEGPARVVFKVTYVVR